MKNKAEVIFVILLFHFIAGILFAVQFPSITLQTYSAYGIIALLLALLFLNIGYLKFKIYRKKPLISVLLYFLLFMMGLWTALKNTDPIQPSYFTKVKTDYLRLIVDEEPQAKGSYLRFRANIQAGYLHKKRIPCKGMVMVTLLNTDSNSLSLNYGDEILLPSRFTAIPKVQNEGEFDYAGWLSNKNIFMQIYIPTKDMNILSHNQGSRIKSFTLRLRKQQIILLKNLIATPEALAVASTLILGYRSELDKETLEAYSKTGTIHVLSVSGMHVGIIYLVLHSILAFLNRSQMTKVLKALLIIMLIWFYAAITGFSPSVLRATLMLSCFIIAKTWYRRSNSYNILAFSAFVLLIDDPLLLYDVGFQLSYCAVWGLLYLQPLLYHKLEFNSWSGDQLWQYLSFSLAAQLATLPLSIYYFHQFPVYFLVSNLLVMLPAALIMYIGFGLLLFRLYFLAPLLEFLITFTNAMLKWIADLPYSTLSAIWITKTELVFLVLFLGLAVSCLEKLNKNRLAFTLISLLLLQTLTTWKEVQTHQQRKINIFILRKNYAKAYLHANQAIIYTDLTPESLGFQRTIKPYLEKNSITEIQIKNPHQQLKKLKHL